MLSAALLSIVYSSPANNIVFLFFPSSPYFFVVRHIKNIAWLAFWLSSKFLLVLLKCSSKCSTLAMQLPAKKREFQQCDISRIDLYYLKSWMYGRTDGRTVVRWRHNQNPKFLGSIFFWLWCSPCAELRYYILLKTELRKSDFQHFHWLAGHRLSVHIPAVPNMVKERVSNNASWKQFCSSEKKMAYKSRFAGTGIDLDRNRCFSQKYTEELLILEFLIKQLFYVGLLDI